MQKKFEELKNGDFFIHEFLGLCIKQQSPFYFTDNVYVVSRSIWREVLIHETVTTIERN